MGILWTIFKAVFFPPKLPVSDLPYDWPPDGSLRFIEYGDISWKTIPHTYQNFEFSPNDDEYDERISWLSTEIMKRFCGSRQILTRIYSESNWPPKIQHPPERFTVRYQRFLEHIHSPLSVHAPEERTLFLLGNGFDSLFFWVNRDLDTADSISFDTYILPQELNAANAKEAAEAVAAGQYDVWFDFNEWGPCTLYVTLNPETVDAGALQSMIETICTEHDILLQNPVI